MGVLAAGAAPGRRTTTSSRAAGRRSAGRIGHRPRVVWVGAAPGLLVLAFFSTTLSASGIATTDLFVDEVDSVTGQEKLAEHFPAGEGSPAIVIGPADSLEEMVDGALRRSTASPPVVPYTGAPAGAADRAGTGEPDGDATSGPSPWSSTASCSSTSR